MWVLTVVLFGSRLYFFNVYRVEKSYCPGYANEIGVVHVAIEGSS
jgi:hypothetical protein